MVYVWYVPPYTIPSLSRVLLYCIAVWVCACNLADLLPVQVGECILSTYRVIILPAGHGHLNHKFPYCILFSHRLVLTHNSNQILNPVCRLANQVVTAYVYVYPNLFGQIAQLKGVD